MIRVLVVAEIRLYREGLAQILSRSNDITVVGTAARHEEAVASAVELTPDVVLLDMATSNGLDVARAVAHASPAGRVVALAVPEDDHEVIACAEAGVAGYVPRHASLEELVAVIQSAARGEALCSPRVAASLLRRLAALGGGPNGAGFAGHLTAREREIVRLIDGGLSNKEIARELGIEVATVKNHVHNLLEKLQVHRRGEAAARVRGGRWATSGPHHLV